MFNWFKKKEKEVDELQQARSESSRKKIETSERIMKMMDKIKLERRNHPVHVDIDRRHVEA